MGTHGLTGSRRILPCDRVDDASVLITDFIDSGRTGISKSERAHRMVDHVTQVPHDAHKMRIVRRLRDGQVEVYRRMGRDLPVRRRLLNFLPG